MKKHLFKTLIILFCIIVISCNKEETLVELENESSILQEVDIKYANFLKNKLNIDESNFEYNSDMDAYIIEGDGVFTLTSIDNWMQEFEASEVSKSTNSVAEKSQQQIYSITLDDPSVSLIRIYVESDVSSTSWQTAITDAIIKWNAVGSNVNFAITLIESNADIIVTDYTDLSITTIAWAYYPHSSTLPGRELSINRKYDYFSSNRKLNTIMHEMGHTVGFRHTNTNDGDHISGTATSGTDNSSIMHSSNHGGTDFTYNDEVAISKIYPSDFFSSPYDRTYSIRTQRGMSLNWSSGQFFPWDRITLELYKNDTLYSTIVENYYPNTGSYSYFVPYDLALIDQNMQIRGTISSFGETSNAFRSQIFTYGPNIVY